jgi:hypothetical protein
METVKPRETANTLAALTRSVDSARARIDSSAGRDTTRAARIVALRAAGQLGRLRGTLKDWFAFYRGYDPAFTWWNLDPWRRADSALVRYEKSIRREIVGQKEGEDEPIIGDPIGVEALRAELAFEMIKYGPEDLLRIAEREFAWCETARAAATWDSATTGRPPNGPRTLTWDRQLTVRCDLAREAEQFVESRPVTVRWRKRSGGWRCSRRSSRR